MRGSIVRVARTTAALNDAIGNIDCAMSDLRQTMLLLNAATARFSRAGFAG